MAHFAQLDKNNKVINVVVVDNDITYDTDGVEQEALGIAHLKKLLGENTKWVQTSFNKTTRGEVFAGIGMLYDEKNDVFITEQSGIFEDENGDIYEKDFFGKLGKKIGKAEPIQAIE